MGQSAKPIRENRTITVDFHDESTYFQLIRTSNSLEKKWTFDLSMTRATSGWHIFETNVNRFTLLLQAHGAKPLDDLAQQASLRQG